MEGGGRVRVEEGGEGAFVSFVFVVYGYDVRHTDRYILWSLVIVVSCGVWWICGGVVWFCDGWNHGGVWRVAHVVRLCGVRCDVGCVMCCVITVWRCGVC